MEFVEKNKNIENSQQVEFFQNLYKNNEFDQKIQIIEKINQRSCKTCLNYKTE